MKKRTIVVTVIAFIVIAVAVSLWGSKELMVQPPIAIEIGQVFTAIEYPNTKYVLQYKVADINNDESNDVIILVGEKESVEATSANNIDVVWYNGAMQTYGNADLKKLEGDMPRLELVDVTGDDGLDVVAIVNDAEGDKILRIVTLENNETWKEIFKAKNNETIRFTGSFIDGYKVNVINRKLNVKQEMDLSQDADKWISNGVFDKSGKYLGTAKISTTGFVSVDFVQLTGYMGIQTKQRIILSGTQEPIEEITILWKYEEGKWQMKEATGVKLGNLLY